MQFLILILIPTCFSASYLRAFKLSNIYSSTIRQLTTKWLRKVQG